MKLKEKIEEYFEFIFRTKDYWAARFALAPLFIVFFILIFLLSNWDSRILWIKNKTSTNKIYVKKSGMNNNELIKIK